MIRMIGMIGAGMENILPLQMDDAPVPDELKNALYSRNIIPASGREASENEAALKELK